MSAAAIPPQVLEERLRMLKECGGIRTLTAEKLGIPVGTLHHTLRTAKRMGIEFPNAPFNPNRPVAVGVREHRGRIDLEIEDGIVLVGSDAHIWPGDPTPAMRAFVWACRKFRKELRAVVLNGDIVDGARISRHPSIGWESKPTLIEELGAVQKQLREIRKAASDGPEYIWTLGNHDARFETAIANALPEFERVQGVHLRDHFPDWEPAWSCWINDDLVIKHRFKGGIHAPWNNTIYAGKSIATGHLHSLKVTPFSDYNGTRWGVDTGTLSAPYSDPFVHYTEANPVNWRAGFVVFTFRKGEMLWPELVVVRDKDSWMFRGQVFSDAG